MKVYCGDISECGYLKGGWAILVGCLCDLALAHSSSDKVTPPGCGLVGVLILPPGLGLALGSLPPVSRADPLAV